MKRQSTWEENIQRIRQFRETGDYGAAVNEGGKILEKLLGELYHEGRGIMDETRIKTLDKYLDKTGLGRRPTDQWTLGQLVDVIAAQQVLNVLAPQYQGRTEYVNWAMLEKMVVLRNRADHYKKKTITARDVDDFLDMLAFYLRQFNRLAAEGSLGVRRKPFVVPDLHGATEYLSEVAEYLATSPKNDISINLLGLTLYQAWDIIEGKIIDRIQRSGECPLLHIDLGSVPK